MAIPHIKTSHVCRSAGRSAVAAAAYRSGQELTNARDNMTWDYTAKQGVLHTEIVLPEGVAPPGREALWNAAEAAEKRVDARTAREWVVAIPHELDAEQRRELVLAFARKLANQERVAVDVSLHAPDKGGDQRNWHAHLLCTTREIRGDGGLGQKAALELGDKDRAKIGLGKAREAITEIRGMWAETANYALEQAGLEVRVDTRSYAARGIDLEPSLHEGVAVRAMERKGIQTRIGDENRQTRARNLAVFEESPEKLLAAVAARQAVFTRQDLARELARYTDDAQRFQAILVRAEQSPVLVQLAPALLDERGREREPARLSTLEMVRTEIGLAECAKRMAAAKGFAVPAATLDAAVARSATLSGEQEAAMSHLVAAGRLSCLVGDAGTGKSFSLKVAKEAWEAEGFTVVGAALAGKAADGLAAGTGIKSSTLHSLEKRWERAEAGKGPKEDLLTHRSVLVIDEAGMLGAAQVGRVLAKAESVGAKVVLIGDEKQLQPIEAGGPFRAIVERVGAAEVTEIRRQREAWAQEASRQFARGDVGQALAAYEARGKVQIAATTEQARAAMVADYLAAPGDKIMLAHARVDVQALNEEARAQLVAQGAIGRESVSIATERGVRVFAPGDRVVFLQNDRQLDVKNGQLATVEKIGVDLQSGHPRLLVRLDNGCPCEIHTQTYAALDHGYALTVHKAQGVTVDQAFVLASRTMDRHLAYVAMTRHRDEARLYASGEQFKDVEALAKVLSRERPKESTLDYDLSPFAERRGFDAQRAVEWVKERIVPVYEKIAERMGWRVTEAAPRPAESGTAERAAPAASEEKIDTFQRWQAEKAAADAKPQNKHDTFQQWRAEKNNPQQTKPEPQQKQAPERSKGNEYEP